jgi:DNA mismatch repair protein MutL
MAIKILDNFLINKIAAGEVIENPASVVKELLENSLDSKADEIKIEIFDSGLAKIKITDNGLGMDEKDLLLSYKSHATSKISSTKDLEEISSLGFRGEALSSIAHISNLKISSKTKKMDFGNLIEVEAGIFKKSFQVAIPTGTIIEVSDLFFNVPARKKFLKSKEIEFSKILNLVIKYSLINPQLKISLIKDGKIVLNSQKTTTILNNLLFIYGKEIVSNLIPVDFEKNGIKIFGYISKPNLTRSDKQEQSIYVNQRYVLNKTISDAVYQAYKTLLFTQRHPIFVLEIKMPLNDLDVNVHPSKRIIRLKNPALIFETVYEAIKDAFNKNNLIPKANVELNSLAKSQKSYPFSFERQSTLVKETKETYSTQNKSFENVLERENKAENFGPFYILGQVNKTFIICDSPNGLAIIDQHAAQERVNYEKFLEKYSSNSIKTQKLVTPKVLELTPLQFFAVKNNKAFLKKLGYDFQEFGENSIKLNSIPEIFGRLRSVLFIDILNEIIKEKATLIDLEIEKRIIRFSCRASVKAGDELTLPQIKELILELKNCKNPYTCPHGRPTIINLSIADLEKKFKRTGW